MLIVLDTSAVTRDARFETFVRDALDHGGRVLVPRLVLVEVAHRYQRESVAMIDALTVQARMYDRLGLREDLSVFVDAARAKADGYVDSLARQLEAMGCDVIEPAHVSHLDIAGRELQRRRPYVDKKRHGYTATVNWLTVLDIADRRPSEDVVWVSANSRAFGSGEPSTWHDEIWAELQDRGLENRVRWVVDLDDVDLRDTDVPCRERVFEPVVPPLPAIAVPAPLPSRPPLPPRAPVATPDTVEPPAATLPPVHVARPRVAPQRILPSGNADAGGRRGIGRMMGGRKRKVTVVDELDELDFG
ncbi:PIN domain-containing protein [Rhodococcus sp. IEGM 1307]|uniref:PIN domain-containing protein n=1 Tax=Rhodococcus sp. IEGM 1307 TaxID=3047091 RepID=UPI0024B723CF|nr:PIN domain-containing protein [Rhodococcus sp. IEGM 1307]MDI9974969.1 PIN domain-containing protein [Rhodococcus sp. IEGM 1307]